LQAILGIPRNEGVDPKTGERLAQVGGREWTHSARWDMTFSAPKPDSV
jgi:hypothetical protein